MLGAHLLVQLLDAGQTVRATYRTASSLEKAKHVFSYFTDQVDKEFSKIEWVQADVREVSSLEALFKTLKRSTTWQLWSLLTPLAIQRCARSIFMERPM